MQKKALLVGINKYRNPNAELKGCVNDVNRARDFLQERYGFDRSDITTLTDADATRKAIIDEFSSLIRFALEGDRIFFWYSGHGTQKYTPDVSETDQLSECIVPWETTGESLIEDKWFGDELKKIVSRGFAANVTLVFDCCHSGTITRAFVLDQNRDPFVKNRHIPFSELVDVAPANESKIQTIAKGLRARGTFRGMRSLALGAWDVLSACQDLQEAADTFLEGESRGIFSYSLLKALNEDPLTTLGALENRLKADIRALLPSHEQEPAFEVRNSKSTFMEIPPIPGTDVRGIPISSNQFDQFDFATRGGRSEFSAYAGPLVFGPWVNVASHMGTATFSISAEPIGSTVLVGEVRYFATDGSQRTESFTKSVSVRTGNSIANVEVRFKGVPLGSAVRGFVI